MCVTLFVEEAEGTRQSTVELRLSFTPHQDAPHCVCETAWFNEFEYSDFDAPDVQMVHIYPRYMCNCFGFENLSLVDLILTY